MPAKLLNKLLRKKVRDMDMNLVLWRWSTRTRTQTKVLVLVLTHFFSTRTRTHAKQSTRTRTRTQDLCTRPNPDMVTFFPAWNFHWSLLILKLTLSTGKWSTAISLLGILESQKLPSIYVYYTVFQKSPSHPQEHGLFNSCVYHSIPPRPCRGGLICTQGWF